MRTSQEIQVELDALERQIVKGFIRRSTLAQIMTPRQKEKWEKLFKEWYAALKSEGRP